MMAYEVKVTRIAAMHEVKRAFETLKIYHPTVELTMPTSTMLGVKLATDNLKEAELFLDRANAYMAEV